MGLAVENLTEVFMGEFYTSDCVSERLFI
jgi:hypothetical protein